MFLRNLDGIHSRGRHNLGWGWRSGR